MSVAILFPGQGSQYPGMLTALPDNHVVDEVRAVAATHFAARGIEPNLDRPEAFTDTTNAQLALLLAGVASAWCLRDLHGLSPAFVAGHSVGAYAAAVTAGVLTLPEALDAVHLRGHLMKQAAAPEKSWGMAALSGLPTQTAHTLVERMTRLAEPLWVANINSATQTVLGGTTTALAVAEDAAFHLGAASFEKLSVAVPSHGPLQTPVSVGLTRWLSAVPRRDPTARYLTNVGGRVAKTSATVLDDLAKSVCKPVRWHDAVQLMAELGVTCTVEAHPGNVLTRLVHQIAPSLTAVASHDTALPSAAAIAANSSVWHAKPFQKRQ